VLKPGQRFGFHNLRHSLATFLINKEQDTKTVQGLLRHANVSTTLGLYAQSVNSSMVKAQESMLKAILRNGSNAVNWAADDQRLHSNITRRIVLGFVAVGIAAFGWILWPYSLNVRPTNVRFANRGAAGQTYSFRFTNRSDKDLYASQLKFRIHSRTLSGKDFLINIPTASRKAYGEGVVGAQRFADIQGFLCHDSYQLAHEKGGMETKVETYDGCQQGAQVVSYSVKGGGNTWPGGEQYEVEKQVGKTSQDLNANETIWSFLSTRKLAVKSGTDSSPSAK